MERVRKILGLLPANAGEYARKTFNIGIFGVKNNFVLAGILLIGFCVIAPAVFVTAFIDQKIETQDVWEVMLIYSIIAAYVGGVLIPGVMFAYVHKRRDRDFYHSMPVKRGQYFIGYFAAGLVMFIAPYLLMCTIMGVLGFALTTAFSFVFPTIGMYIVVYSTVLISMMFSGSLLSSVVTLAFLNTFPVVVTYCSLLLSGNLDSTAYMTLLEPYIHICTPLTTGYVFFMHFNNGIMGWLLPLQLCVAVIELVLSFIMYQFRKGETTMAVAFPKTRYILQYGTMFLVAQFCISVFGDLFYYQGGIRPETIIWTSIMVFVTFVVLNMILERNFRAAFHRIRHLLVFAGAYVVVLAVIIGITNIMPYFVIPIPTDAVLIRMEHYINTYDKPEDYQSDYQVNDYPVEVPEDYYYDPYIYGYDEDGVPYYRINFEDEYYLVTDSEQVKELTKRISDYENNRRDISPYAYSTVEGEYYYCVMSLYNLKFGETITQGTKINDLRSKSSQSYTVYLNRMSVTDMEKLVDGLDLIKAEYRSDYYYDF